jgi:murein DD-endopeptidase MepM/ murein hydrolase activator NlpD
MKRKLGVALVLLLSSCGGNEPLSLLGDPVINETTGLNLPIPSTAIQSVNAFSSSNDGIQINYAAFGSSQVVVAPLAGTVVNVDTALNPGFTAVTLYHSARLSSRMAFLQIASVRVGDYVNTGDQVGTLSVSTGSGIKLSVYIDGSATAVCPFSYLSSSARTAFITAFGGNFPCI